jgi:hypothetical protein
MASGVDDDDGNAASIVKGIDGKMGELATELADKMKAFKSPQELRQWAKMNEAGFDMLEESDRQRLRVVYEDCVAAFSNQALSEPTKATPRLEKKAKAE